MQRAGRGQGGLDHAVGLGLDLRELFRGDAAGTLDFGHGAAGAEMVVVAAGVVKDELGLGQREPVEGGEKARHPTGAAELAVGDHAKADRFLQPDRVRHGAVQHFGVGRLRQRPGAELLAGFLERARPQQAADMLGAKRRVVGHGVTWVKSNRTPQLPPSPCPSPDGRGNPLAPTLTTHLRR